MAFSRHTTVRQWIHRNGCRQLTQPVEQAKDWVVLADLTVDIGIMKCLAMIGIKMDVVESQNNMILSHSDVKVLGLYPTEKSNGDFFEKALLEVKDKVGNICAIVIDEGSDVKKGARLYQEKHPEIKVLHDIKHKLSLVMKRNLEKDPNWSSYTTSLAQTRKLVYQTELAALKPPVQRSKARFMDIAPFVDWPIRILEAKCNGNLDSILEDRYQQYFGWIEQYVGCINVWSFMVKIVEMICHEIRTHGLSEAVYEYLITFFLEASLDDKIQLFAAEALEKVLEEVNKLDPGQTLISSTEVLESLFGKYKEVNGGKHGITSNVLGLGTLVGGQRTDEDIKNTMEDCSVKQACHWIKKKVGISVSGLRRKLLPREKRTKFNKNKKGAILS